MNFDFGKSTTKHVFDYYDGIPLITIHTYENVDYFLYAITWDRSLDKCEYMLATIDEKGFEQVIKEGVKSFLNSMLKENKLYHHTFGFWEDSPKDEIRHLTKEEAIKAFPTNERVLDYKC
ncbi:hypothetical protein [Viridibacillus arvi]|uniref:hypothetical protein n=1 Tax=Viridibacillus arvi TaxID=263475 RepID=UPI0034CE0721